MTGKKSSGRALLRKATKFHRSRKNGKESDFIAKISASIDLSDTLVDESYLNMNLSDVEKIYIEKEPSIEFFFSTMLNFKDTKKIVDSFIEEDTEARRY